MTYDNQKKVACIGIGGAGVYYVARFFLNLGCEVYGFDIKESERTKELEQQGARILYENPKEALEAGTTLFVYAPGLPDQLLSELLTQNIKIPSQDVGAFTDELAQKFEKDELSVNEKKAFISAEIGPLYTLDTSKMKYIAVTGTDGKTTTSTMIYHMLQELGFKPGLISTVSAKIGDETIDTGFHTTTPAPQELFKFLKLMEEKGCTHAVVETTSHALAMGRLAGLHFDAVAYTNITSEHLDYHKTWENYFTAKARLLSEHLKQTGFAVINADDKKSFKKLLEIAQSKERSAISYGEQPSADRVIDNIAERGKLSFRFAGENITIPILGRFNVWNASAAILLVSELEKLPISQVAPKLSNFTTITGRMQVEQTDPFTVIVDFAHTANALENALKTAATQKASPDNRIITVFGCAGKRDAGKRVPMGEAAAKFADITILTAEDPRTEKLEEINDSIQKGWSSFASHKKQLIRFDDDTILAEVRKQSIELALKLAKPGDVVIICGKAHEESLCFGVTEYPWNDIQAVRKLLGKRN